MEVSDLIIKAMREAGKPLKTGELVELTGLSKDQVDKAFKLLKKEEKIVSPVRCFWEPK